MMNRKASSAFVVADLREVWKEYRNKIFSQVELEEPKFLIVKRFPDNRIASYSAAFSAKELLISEYRFLSPPSENALREAMIHEMVHHCDAIVNGPSELRHGRYFFSWREKVKEFGFHLGRKVHWE